MAQPKRALIVIDVQNEYVSGDLLIEYPPVDQSPGQYRPGDGRRHRRRHPRGAGAAPGA